MIKKSIAIGNVFDKEMNDNYCEDSEDESSEDEGKNWDCESILTTLTNTDNHPGVIKSEKRIVKINSKNKFDLHR